MIMVGTAHKDSYGGSGDNESPDRLILRLLLTLMILTVSVITKG